MNVMDRKIILTDQKRRLRVKEQEVRENQEALLRSIALYGLPSPVNRYLQIAKTCYETAQRDRDRVRDNPPGKTPKEQVDEWKRVLCVKEDTLYECTQTLVEGMRFYDLPPETNWMLKRTLRQYKAAIVSRDRVIEEIEGAPPEEGEQWNSQSKRPTVAPLMHLRQQR